MPAATWWPSVVQGHVMHLPETVAGRPRTIRHAGGEAIVAVCRSWVRPPTDEAAGQHCPDCVEVASAWGP